MELSFEAQTEITLDNLITRVKALEDILIRFPQISMQPDISRPQTLIVEPAGLANG